MIRWGKGLPILLAVGLLAWVGITAPGARAAEAPILYFVTITVNDVDRSGVYPALARGDEFALGVEAFRTLGFLVPEVTPEDYHGQQYLPLSALKGASYIFDSQHLSLKITCKAVCFPGSGVTGVWQPPKVDPTPFGAFLNYDLVAEKNTSANYIGALTELGVFSEHGTGIMTAAASHQSSDTSLTRLETSWTIDRAEKRQRWRFGDSITEPGGWGRASRFGGIQFGTDFSLQPGFVTFPTPTILGEASLPSTADIYVNGVQRSSVQVEPGPFTIEQPPVITGSGDLKVVVRDLLGRETVLIQPFYASRNLLRRGLASFSVEAGALRQNYGIGSFDYGDVFVSGSFRKGFSDHLTAGLHVEASGKRAGIGPNIDWQMPFGGILSAATAVSVNHGRFGAILQTNFNWTSHNFGVQVSHEMTTKDFARLGTAEGVREARMRTSANAGLDLSRYGAVSLNYTRVDERDSDDFEIVSANYSKRVGNLGTLGVNASKSFGAFADTMLYISFTTRLGDRTTGSASLDRSAGQWTGTARVTNSAPYEGGFGYRAEASRDQTQRGRAGVTYEGSHGRLDLDVSKTQSGEAARLGARGGVIFIGGDTYMTRTVDESFALVEVGDFEGIGVLKENRRVTETNDKGRALITGLRAFEENRISIDPLDLPLSADIGTSAMVRVPRRRSGVVAAFPIGRVRSAVARIVDVSGTPLKPGTMMHALDGGSDFPVGFGGEVYMMGLTKPMRFEARLKTGACRITIPAVAASPVPIRLGVIVCKGDSR
ncbi:fimbria/pilus outer membrane usher protein [Kordiimonas marina]|uniref:fimbria/pilus outer membrane usher protein n=1 Tax=Kordiimonas marina TaxID=2872312 RepID=UPI001FF13B41|nr:fimbria/pilus outer membrane usher protein [Kordiimonas marina]MCJ9430623.1 fimbria/pilus outer membrane usher protein [Kordiimonas marina]